MKLLSKREKQVAELLAWGASKKEVPDLLKKLYGGKEISVHTVENITRNIYAKLHLNKSSELSAWYFCECHQVDDSLSPIKRAKKTALAIIFLILMIPQVFDYNDQVFSRSNRPVRVVRVIRSRRIWTYH